MKYSSSNKPLVCMQTQSTCYKGTKKMTIKGVLWHSTAANNPTLKRYVQPSDTKPAADTYTKAKWLEVLGTNANKNDWNHIYREAGLNCWVGQLANGTITTVQTMPWDYRPWGCGSGSKGSCNDGWIQFEICEADTSDKTYFNKVYKEACEITAYLCKLYNINPKGKVTHNGVSVPTILCHQDAYKLGLGSNHSDIYHWFNKHGKTMDDVRNDVAALIGSTTTTATITTVKTYKVVTPINKYSTAADAKAKTNPGKEKFDAGTYYIYNKYPNGVDGMYNISTDKTGASAGAWINPSENVAPATSTAKTYKTVAEINKYSTSGDAVAQKNPVGKLAVGTYYIYNKYPDGVNGVYNISTDKTGASAGSWINPKENVVKTAAQTVEKIYRVRKSKDDAVSQKGAYADLNNAKEACQKAGEGYHVFDWEYKIVYSYTKPVQITLSSISITKMPTKTEYFVGDKYDGTGLVVTAKYSDDSTKTITNYSTSGFNSEKVGTTTVSVIFEGKATSFNLTIKEKPAEVAVYDLNYPEKVKIVSKIKRTNKECAKIIEYILTKNKNFDPAIAKEFFEVGHLYGIDPMMAISQSILETGWFKYEGSAVTADQHNYCGLAVTSLGVKGASFPTIREGVIAQIQHLYAYGCKDTLPSGQTTILDPRFNLVSRGVAPYWQQLAGRWACPGWDKAKYATPELAMEAENTYGQKILNLFKTLDKQAEVNNEILEKYFPSPEPDVKEPTPEVEVDIPNVEEPKEDVEEPKVEVNDPSQEEGSDISVEEIGKWKLVFEYFKKLILLLADLFK